jgi:hypothetical protein
MGSYGKTMKDDPKIVIIGYDELNAEFSEVREAAFNSDMSFDPNSNWDPETDTIELKNDYCHRDAPMRVFYSLADGTFETLLFRCSVCGCVVMKIRVGCSEELE